METSTIDLVGSTISGVEQLGDEVKVHFSPAFIIKTMTGAQENTRWKQSGAIVFGNATLESSDITFPQTCTGGDVGENIYTYRDMVPLPLESRGHTHCNIKLQDSDTNIVISGETIHTEMIATPKYIEHFTPE